MKDGRHEHTLENRFGLHHHKKTFGIAVFALVFAFVTYASIQGGGGGVSFNGSAVDLNGSQLYNGTFDGINETLNTKVNKSGDIMTGDLNFSNYSTDVNNLYSEKVNFLNASLNSREYVSSGYNATLVDLIFPDGENTQRQFDKWFEVLNNYNQSSLFFTFTTNNSKFIALDFRIGPTLYWRFGMDNDDDFKVKRYGGTGNFTIDSADVKIINLAGAGNAYACLDANGKMFRSSSPCA